MVQFRVLELFSGIGGMHYSLRASNIDGEIVAAVDINTVANNVYSHNFPLTNIMNKNIQSLSSKLINDLNVNIILMSPPCQPFTRNGLNNDYKDSRSDALTHIIEILKDLKSIDYILLENVKGFENSKIRDKFISALTDCKFYFNEYLLNPLQIGIPNSRLRYYCLARKSPLPYSSANILVKFPYLDQQCYRIKNIIENDIDDSIYLLTAKQLLKAQLLDICHDNSMKSCCFTKSYTHFLEGTGSVYTYCQEEEIKRVFEIINETDINSKEYINNLKLLKLRFFTPKEIAKLMAFPEDFKFPYNITNKQCYRLLGNSINIDVVKHLLNLLFSAL